jgi:hypothetical protein
MTKEFVPYELALKLKQLSFDDPCFGRYYNEEFELDHGVWNSLDVEHIIAAPTFSQAFRWLLKEYNLYAIIIPTVTMHWTFKTMTVVEDIVEVPPYDHVDANDYGTREEAELACLVKLIEIVETKSE